MTTETLAVPVEASASAEDGLPSMLRVTRSDPVYMAHAHLTKVPVAAIVPFIEAFTEPGQVVLDLMLTLRPASRLSEALQPPSAEAVGHLVDSLLEGDSVISPSGLYVALLRHGIANRWDLSRIDLRKVTERLHGAEFTIDRRSALVVRSAED